MSKRPPIEAFSTPVANSNHSHLQSVHDPVELAEAVFICLCNYVTDRELVEAAAGFASGPETGDSASFAKQVADRLGAGLGCGSCREFALELVERAATQRNMVILPDREPVPAGLDIALAKGCEPSFERVALRNDGAVTSQGE